MKYKINKTFKYDNLAWVEIAHFIDKSLRLSFLALKKVSKLDYIKNIKIHHDILLWGDSK